MRTGMFFPGKFSRLLHGPRSTGKIVAARSMHNSQEENVAIYRFDPLTGALDPTFGGGDGIERDSARTDRDPLPP